MPCSGESLTEVKAGGASSRHPAPMQTALLPPHQAMAMSLDAVAEAGVDIVPVYFERFFAQHEGNLSDADVAGLDQLLDLPDNALLDLILERTQLEGEGATPDAVRVLQMLRTA